LSTVAKLAVFLYFSVFSFSPHLEMPIYLSIKLLDWREIQSFK